LALRTMPIAAGIVSNGGIAAVLVAFDMAAEGCRAAALNGRHHLQLLKAEMAGIGQPPYRTAAAENIRDLQGRARHVRRASGGRAKLFELDGNMLERALHRTDSLGGDPRVERGAIELGVAEQNLVTRISVFCSNRWVAKLCRKVWGETFFSIPPPRPHCGRRD
jgi:hypothetical protein